MCGALIRLFALVFDCNFINCMRRLCFDVASFEVFLDIRLSPITKPNSVVSTSDGLHDKIHA